MTVKVYIPKYHSKDLVVMIATMLPMTLFLCFLFFDNYFSNVGTFLSITLVSFIFYSCAFITYGIVAIALRNRFPEERQFYKRIGICLGVFYLMSAVYISMLLFSFDYFSFFGYQYSDDDFTHGWLCLVVINTFLTFLNEGIYRFENYRNTIIETEQLKNEYLRSQVLSLKSQLNPHFLFNSLNTLSSLIHEDESTAEEFLDHMSKVYRYLLKNDEQLVPLEMELEFIRSYAFLLRSRHGEGLQINIPASASEARCNIPPLTLQMIIENAVNNNFISRSTPLEINIAVSANCLEISNTVQPKVNGTEEPADMWVNLTNKCRLLAQRELSIHNKGSIRTICLPLVADEKLLKYE